ncbi:MAG TPA: bifunctional phosphopantothenoylcysteine decarboxylase/phosphopantothenate--cysteine ligase CoaBC [Gemmatimonadales bacterium]
MRLAGRRLLLGVSGGIACYKSCILVRRLREAGALVDVVMTRGATRFVRPVTFEALSGRPVRTSLWTRGEALDHVRLAEEAELIVLAPATADLLARAALGLADDLLTSMLLARSGPVLAAPAMNDRMFAAAPTRSHIASLAARGWHFVGPAIGPLAEGESDTPGRMSEPEEIAEHAARLLLSGGPLQGSRVVVTAGPTREAIDPVRVITNRSSGKMGYRLAEAAWRRGALVTLISGPSSETAHSGINTIRVESTAELRDRLAERLPETDVLIMAAAPADYAPANRATEKTPRQSGNLTLALVSTPDILSDTKSLRKAGMLTVGFALETGDALAKGRAKLERKDLDLIVVNDALQPGAGFEVDTNIVSILHKDSRQTNVSLASKAQIAEAILDVVEAEL